MPPPMNQASALVHIYLDGSVMVLPGGVECGQGLYTKLAQIAAQTLEVPLAKVHVPETNTDKNATPNITGGSSTADYSGNAVRLACEELNKRLAPMKAANPAGPWEVGTNIEIHQSVKLEFIM